MANTIKSIKKDIDELTQAVSQGWLLTQKDIIWSKKRIAYLKKELKQLEDK